MGAAVQRWPGVERITITSPSWVEYGYEEPGEDAVEDLPE
jgi:hypothetical protein